MQIETQLPLCRLRPWRMADKPGLIRNANNRKVWRNLTDQFPHPYGEAEADQWLQIANEPGRSLQFAIEFEGEAVGGIGAMAGEGISHQTAQFGYWLGESFWGKGIATASARALTAFLESEHAFARLEAPVFIWNPASMRVLEKVGFIRESVRPNSVTKDGCLIDSIMYAYIIPGCHVHRKMPDHEIQ